MSKAGWPGKPLRKEGMLIFGFGRWLSRRVLLTLCLNQLGNENPAACLQLPFNFTILIMRVLIVWKVSLENLACILRTL